MLEDPRIEALRRTFERRPAQAAARSADMREAAVALVLRPREQVELLLIHRAELHGDPWSGHIALPGGRRGPADADLLATACRETDEEVGIPLHREESFIGVLDEVAPATPHLPPIVIAPFVFAVPPDTPAEPDPREVQGTLWVPVDALRDPTALSEITIEMSGIDRAFPSFVYGDYVVWGLTYRILSRFLEVSRE